VAGHDTTRLRSRERAGTRERVRQTRVRSCCGPDVPISTTVTFAATSRCAAVDPSSGLRAGHPEGRRRAELIRPSNEPPVAAARHHPTRPSSHDRPPASALQVARPETVRGGQVSMKRVLDAVDVVGRTRHRSQSRHHHLLVPPPRGRPSATLRAERPVNTRSHRFRSVRVGTSVRLSFGRVVRCFVGTVEIRSAAGAHSAAAPCLEAFGCRDGGSARRGARVPLYLRLPRGGRPWTPSAVRLQRRSPSTHWGGSPTGGRWLHTRSPGVESPTASAPGVTRGVRTWRLVRSRRGGGRCRSRSVARSPTGSARSR
jgi:hypothetical protein